MSEQIKQPCIDFCPKMALAEKMYQKGRGYLLTEIMADSSCSGPEFEMEDGSLVDSATYFGLTDIDDATLAQYHEVGTALTTSGKELKELLLEGCAGKPTLLQSTNVYICSSTNRSDVEFTEADLA